MFKIEARNPANQVECNRLARRLNSQITTRESRAEVRNSWAGDETLWAIEVLSAQEFDLVKSIDWVESDSVTT